MKKICFFVDSIYTLGGIQRIVTSLCNKLYHDYDLTVVCQKNVKDKIDYKLNKNVNVIVIDNDFYYVDKIVFLPIRFIKFLLLKLKIKTKFSKRIINFDYKIFKRIKLINYFNRSKFDYIISEGLNNNIYLSKFKNKILSPIIGCWHSNYHNYVESGDYEFKDIKHSLELLDKTIVLSKSDANMIYDKFGVKVDYIYNFIPSDSVSKSKLTNKVFLSVGRYAEVKGYKRLIEMFKVFNEYDNSWKLVLVGDGPQKKDLQDLINKLELENYVVLTGKTNNVDEYYSSSSIFLVSSYGEGFPMVVVEAMKYGLPIIAYDIPVLHEILPNSDYILQQDDSVSYIECMKKLSFSMELRKKASNDNINQSKLFYDDIIIKKWRNLLK